MRWLTTSYGHRPAPSARKSTRRLKLKELGEKLKKLDEKYPRLSTAMTLAEGSRALADTCAGSRQLGREGRASDAGDTGLAASAEGR